MPAGTSAPLDYERLAEFLAALAYPSRLELLHVLRFPKSLGQIRVTAHRIEPGGNPERIASRPTVLGHLEKLMEAGLVRAEVSEEEGKSGKSYVVNPQRLYALVEDMRRLSTMYAGYGVGEDATGTLAVDAPEPESSGPRLVLVHGVYEGKAFKLDAATASGGGWTIGRGDDVSVSLDYDPYVSGENARVEKTAAGFRVSDVASKNGTSVNWRYLPRGGTRALRSGDLIGVGRSRLLFLES